MRLVIDRFEADYAILIDDNENSYNIDKRLFKDNKEGDIIYITYDKDETERQKDKINKLVNKLFEE